jgi:hypothetical protein
MRITAMPTPSSSTLIGLDEYTFTGQSPASVSVPSTPQPLGYNLLQDGAIEIEGDENYYLAEPQTSDLSDYIAYPFSPPPLFLGTESLRSDLGEEDNALDNTIGITADHTAMLLLEGREATWTPLRTNDVLTIDHYKAAEQMRRQELKIREEGLGKEHPDTIYSLYSLAQLLEKQGRYAEAEQM